MLQQLRLSRESRTWLLLMLLSLISWQLGGSHGSNPTISVLVLISLAFFKVHLIMGDFMEVRHAPRVLKMTAAAWLLASYLLVMFFNLGGAQ